LKHGRSLSATFLAESQEHDHDGEAVTKVDGDVSRGRLRPAWSWSLVAAVVALTIIIWLTAFKQAMLIPLSHDEHQFVAAGRLVADGLLPYRDFPSNHMPYLALVYAAIFKATNWDLMPARVVSAVSAALATAIVFALTSSFLRGRRVFTRFTVSGAACLLLITNPIFTYTSGRAWNHDFPTLLTLAAVGLFLRAKPSAHPRRWLLTSGALVGLAIGTRLTYLLALLPFGFAILFGRSASEELGKRSASIAFGAGLALASLPWLALFAAAPRQFVFGNITYQTLNTDYRELLAHRVGETLLGKAVFFYHLLVDNPANLLLFLAFGIAAVWIAAQLLKRNLDLSREIILLGGLALVLFAGAFAATPSWYQYFYAPVPFLVLTITLAASFVRPADAHWERTLSWIAAVVLLAGGIGVVSQSDWRSVRDAGSWIPVQAHELGDEVAGFVRQGTVLTLAPIFPLEGGLGIYNSLATGPFSWRVAPLLTQEKRREMGLITYGDLGTSLEANPPAAILVGFEAGNEGFEQGSIGGLEVPLDEYAREHGYTLEVLKTPLTKYEVRLWIR
jgi:4-amino-4-deoxy-L-arabinose transferase-like glycosyltransferase